MELLDLEFSGTVNNLGSVLGSEEHTSIVLVFLVFVDLNSGVRSYPFSIPIVEVTVRTLEDVLLNINLLEVILEINGGLLILVA